MGKVTKKASRLGTQPSVFVALNIKARRSTAGVLFSVLMGHIWSSYISRKDPCRPIGLLILAVSACLWAFECHKLYKKIPLFELEMPIIDEFV